MLKKIGILVVVSTLIAGCSTGPKMQMFQGKIYYPDWSKYDHCSPTYDVHEGRVMACSKNNLLVEYIYPLTEEQLNYHRRTAEAAERKKESESVNVLQMLNVFSAGLNAFADGLNGTSNPSRYRPPTSSYNSYTPSNAPSGYKSSFGSTYEYDLSNPSDRVRYRADPKAKLRDRLDVNPQRRIERNMGEHGGGVLNDNNNNSLKWNWVD